jgi:Transposase, Mutator family
MTTREIQGHLQEIYGVEVSPSLISEVTDAVIEEVKAWQAERVEEGQKLRKTVHEIAFTCPSPKSTRVCCRCSKCGLVRVNPVDSL